MTQYTYTIGRGTQKVFENFEIWKYKKEIKSENILHTYYTWISLNELSHFDRLWTNFLEFEPTGSIDEPTWPNVNHFESISEPLGPDWTPNTNRQNQSLFILKSEKV